MRIRPRPAQPTQRSADKEVHAQGGSIRLALIVVLAAVLLIVAGIWYKAEGYQLVDPLFGDLFIQEVTNPNDLPALHLDIRANDYQAMAKQRLRAVETGVLQVDDEVWREAHIQLQETKIPVRVRLKGDEPDQTHPADHWQSEKWSFQIETQDSTSILGMRSFSLQSPATGAYLNEWLYAEGLRRAGILAPRYAFVHAFVNGRDWGIYALQEAPSKELLASQQRKEGVILRPKANLSVSQHRQDGIFPADAIETPYSLPAFAQMDVLYAGAEQSDAALSGQAVDALGLLQAYQSQRLTASQVFDAELLGRYMAHVNLWEAGSGLVWYGEHYYYNPLTARLEPIGYGARPFTGAYAGAAKAPYDDLVVMEAYAQEAIRISQPEYLEEFLSAYGAEFSRYRAALLQEFLPEYLQAPWGALAERQALLHASLHPAQTVYAYQSSTYRVGDERRSTIDVEVDNLLRYPVVLQQVRVGKGSVDVQPNWVIEFPQLPSASWSRMTHPSIPARCSWLPPWSALETR
jgi:hypothetical protein